MPFLDGKPVIITKRNTNKNGSPISVKQIETKQVIDIHNSIPLNYSIDRNYPIYINGLYQAYNQNQIGTNNFFADYDQGILYFHPSQVGKSLTITYMATGYILISSDRVYRYNSMNGANTNESIEASFEKLENLMNIIIQSGGTVGNIDAEVIASRTDAKGNTFISLGDRLNHITQMLDNIIMITRYDNTVNIQTTEKTVEIGINEYNPKKDILSVYLSGVRMIKDVDFTIDEVNKTITCKNGNWNIGDDIYFEVLQRNNDNTPPQQNPPISGSSANRPTKNIYIGFQYFDITLGKPIWCKDTNGMWVDANGVVV